MEIIFHIGTYKTGTTTIQQFFRKEFSTLISSGIYYPEVPDIYQNRNQHGFMVLLLLNNPNLLKEYIDECINHAKLSNCKLIVFSSEGFSSLNFEQIKFLISLFPGECKFNAVLYLRNIYKYTLSLISQLLKVPDEDLFNRRLKHNLSVRLNYKTIAESWKEACGSISIKSYEQTLRQKGVLNEFMQCCGLDYSFIKDEPVNKNIGLGVTPMLLLALRGEIKKDSDFIKIANNYFEKGGRPFKITKNEMFLAKFIVDSIGFDYSSKLLDPIKNELFSFDLKDVQPKKASFSKDVTLLLESL